MFIITDAARQFIDRKGKHIRISMQTFLACNRSCRAPQGLTLEPIVQLGEPLPEQRELLTPVDIDGITIWYDNGIVPDVPDQPIRISVQKTFFVYELQVEGVKPQR